MCLPISLTGILKELYFNKHKCGFPKNRGLVHWLGLPEMSYKGQWRLLHAILRSGHKGGMFQRELILDIDNIKLKFYLKLLVTKTKK